MGKNTQNLNSKFKDFFHDRKLTKISIFILVTFTLLYIILILVKNFTTVVPTVGDAISWVLGLFVQFFIGLIIAYIVNPLVNFIERKTKLKRGLSVLVTYLIIVASIALILYGMMAMILGKVVIGNLSDMANTLIETLKTYVASIQKWAASLPSDTVSALVQKIITKLTDLAGDFLNDNTILSTATGFAGAVINLVIGTIFSIYLLLDKDYFIEQWNRFLGFFFPKRKEGLNGTLNEIHVILTKFIKGICVDALIIAILTSIALSLVGVEFAVFLGVFAGLCNIIQYFGPFISMIPTFFVTLLTMDLTHAVVAVVAMIIIQQFDSNLIYPKVVGGSTGLHPLLVLLAVTVGGGIGGLVGMIIGVPVVSILKLLVDKFFAWKVAKKAAELEAAGELPEEFKDTVELQESAQSIPPEENGGSAE